MFRQNDQNDGKQSLTIPLFLLKMKQSILGFTLDDFVCFCLCKWWEF